MDVNLGMLAWVARFTIFAGAAISGTYWVIMIGILIHGICYDFFFVTGQIYVDKKTSTAIRGQAQGLLILLTQWVGMFLGAQFSGAFVNTLGEGGTLSAEDWRLFWGVFAAATFVFAIVFFVFFKDDSDQKAKPTSSTEVGLVYKIIPGNTHKIRTNLSNDFFRVNQPAREPSPSACRL